MAEETPDLKALPRAGTASGSAPKGAASAPQLPVGMSSSSVGTPAYSDYPGGQPIISDGMGTEFGDGPGRSAEFADHVRLFRQKQGSFLAYARVCLAASACQLLLALAYFLIGYQLQRSG